jgi:hypothetical protein
MKNYKIFLLLLLVVMILPLLLLAQTKEKIKSDSSKSKKTVATEIKIGENGIQITTQKGEKLTLDKDSLLSITNEGIKISTEEGVDQPFGEEDLEDSRDYRTSKERVRFWQDITIEEDEKIKGDVVVIGGDLTIKGIITGDAVTVGGNIHMTSTGKVKGDCVAVGGELIKEKGGVISGQDVNVGSRFRTKSFTCFPFIFGGFGSVFHGFAFFSKLIQIAIFIFLGIVIIAIAPKNVEKIKREISQNLLKSFLMGILFFFVLPFIFILLLITVIGIPIAILALPIAVLIALLFGYTAVSLLIGEKIKENTNLKPQTPLLTLIVGVLAIQFASLLGRFFGIFGGPFSPLGWILVAIGVIIVVFTGIVGFGASVLTRFGTWPKEPKVAPVPPTPPTPPIPETGSSTN